MAVSQLGYLVFDVSDLDAWRDLATSVLGAEVREQPGEPGTLRLRFDEHHHRVTLRKAGKDALVAMGLEVPSLGALEQARKAVKARDIAVTDADAGELDARKVQSMFRFRDPDNFPVEVYFGPAVEDVPVRPSRAMSGFNCGPMGLGHALIVTRDNKAAARFYQEVLGFTLTDYIAWDQADAIFLHCNARHHSIAVLNECYGMKSGDLHHFMVEAKSLDDVGRAWDTVNQRKMPIILTLGQHSNDRMTSFYMKTPSGFAIEYGWGGLQVDDASWRVKKYTTPKLWGHELVV